MPDARIMVRASVASTALASATVINKRTAFWSIIKNHDPFTRRVAFTGSSAAV